MKKAQLRHTRFNFWVWQKLPACKEIVKIITASMDTRVSLREWVLMKIHLFSCDPCANFLKQIKLIGTVLRHGDEHIANARPHVHLSDDARARMKQALENSNTGV